MKFCCLHYAIYWRVSVLYNSSSTVSYTFHLQGPRSNPQRKDSTSGKKPEAMLTCHPATSVNIQNLINVTSLLCC